jgi:hypothetical protein
MKEFDSPKAEQFYLDVIRRMTLEERWNLVFEMWEMGAETTRAGIRSQHPDWTEEQVREEFARRVMEANGAARILAARR